MKPIYEIKFLSSDDFEKLPMTETNGSDVSNSLGFHNPYTNKVFIRWSSYPELNKYLLDHEFGHLVEKEPTDEDENGIRHKKFFKDILSLPVYKAVFGGGTTNQKEKKVDAADEAQKQQNTVLGDQKNQQEQQINQLFQSYGGFGNQSGQNSSFGSGQSPLSEQQNSQQGFNQGLNQQTVNPLSDPYGNYGRSAGRLYF